ncbi:hypothetical protein CBY_2897 [Clostridium butyricum 5521]|uniref:Uncharacterized protein n=1 Tax=Clostridium butyricum E4 str. BoNT E BL5262 TaxID=632245 RepID=C4IH22_CLOBU|nr:hypothetical protein CBY_2897 [Clostridium butyricum 5521]EEP54958.1 hypothetical protein CLP_2981 [Clostridium butyricum E4 str. BoNT E BL5262]
MEITELVELLILLFLLLFYKINDKIYNKNNRRFNTPRIITYLNKNIGRNAI